MDKPDDFVRIEIGTALKRGIPVIPILMEGTRAPDGPFVARLNTINEQKQTGPYERSNLRTSAF